MRARRMLQLGMLVLVLACQAPAQETTGLPLHEERLSDRAMRLWVGADDPGTAVVALATRSGVALVTITDLPEAGGEDREAELNRLGYRYLGEQKLDEAVAVLELNAHLYPGSWNVYDSLGEAYLARGDEEIAAELYRRSLQMVERWGNDRQPADTVLDVAGVKPGMVIGEVGAGRGRYTMHLARRVGGTGKVYANDIDSGAITFLRRRCEWEGITNVEPILGSVDDPHFPESSLDMIFMVWVYHMVESPVPLLQSFAHSLKPGAPVVMVEPVPEEIEEELQEMTARGATDAHVNVLTRAAMEEYAGQAGFKLVKVIDDLLEKDIIYILHRE